MRAKIEPSYLNGHVIAPPSKSMAHRLIIGAGLSKKIVKVNNVSYSEDIKATIDCMVSLGAKIETGENFVIVDGREFLTKVTKPLDCNESGSTMRFFIPLALCMGEEVTLKGAKRLLERPLTVYQTLCSNNGFTFKKEEDKVTVNGKLTSGEYVLDGSISSQFITGMILALSTLSGKSTIKITPPFESKSYVDLTLRALNLYGMDVKFENEYAIVINGKGAVKNNEQEDCEEREVSVEGDYSNAAFLEAFNYLGGKITVDGLDAESAQGDKIFIEYFHKLNDGYCTLDIADCPDLAPILMAMAVIKNGAHLTNTARLKIKESDRGVVMAEELKKVGAKITLGDNDIYIEKAILKKPSESFYGHNDHRVVMSLAVLCTLLGGEIEGIEAVKKSYPDFFNKMIDLGMKVKLC